MSQPSPSLEMVFGQKISRIRLGHLFCNTCKLLLNGSRCFPAFWSIQKHAEEIAFEDIDLCMNAAQAGRSPIGLSMAKAWLALLIILLTSWSASVYVYLDSFIIAARRKYGRHRHKSAGHFSFLEDIARYKGLSDSKIVPGSSNCPFFKSLIIIAVYYLGRLSNAQHISCFDNMFVIQTKSVCQVCHLK